MSYKNFQSSPFRQQRPFVLIKIPLVLEAYPLLQRRLTIQIPLFGKLRVPAFLSASGDPLNPIYNPSAADLAVGTVTLTITVDSVAPCAIQVSESFDLAFQVLPVADAGVNLTECDLPFQITTASFDTTTVTNLVWTNGAGDGSFDLDNIINPIYTPGTGDLANGSVTLTLEVLH